MTDNKPQWVIVEKKYKEEPFEKMLRRFKNKVVDFGIFDEIKKYEFYQKPSKLKRAKKLDNLRRNK
jgi:ribosomal protein S21